MWVGQSAVSHTLSYIAQQPGSLSNPPEFYPRVSRFETLRAGCLCDSIVHGNCALWAINPLNPELNPISYLLALLAHHFLHVSRIRVKSLTLRLLMSYIYIYH